MYRWRPISRTRCLGRLALVFLIIFIICPTVVDIYKARKDLAARSQPTYFRELPLEPRQLGDSLNRRDAASYVRRANSTPWAHIGNGFEGDIMFYNESVVIKSFWDPWVDNIRRNCLL